jgi:hypothetical protein
MEPDTPWKFLPKELVKYVPELCPLILQTSTGMGSYLPWFSKHILELCPLIPQICTGKWSYIWHGELCPLILQTRTDMGRCALDSSSYVIVKHRSLFICTLYYDCFPYLVSGVMCMACPKMRSSGCWTDTSIMWLWTAYWAPNTSRHRAGEWALHGGHQTQACTGRVSGHGTGARRFSALYMCTTRAKHTEISKLCWACCRHVIINRLSCNMFQTYLKHFILNRLDPRTT